MNSGCNLRKRELSVGGRRGRFVVAQRLLHRTSGIERISQKPKFETEGYDERKKTEKQLEERSFHYVVLITYNV
jgi:hypothetical protein